MTARAAAAALGAGLALSAPAHADGDRPAPRLAFEVAAGLGKITPIDENTATGYDLGGRVVGELRAPLELFASLDGQHAPSLPLVGGDRYSQTGSMQRARLLVGVGAGSRAPGATGYVRLGAGADLGHVTVTTTDWNDGETTVTTRSETDVAATLAVAAGFGVRRPSGTYGLELSLGGALHDGPAVHEVLLFDVFFVYGTR